MKTMDKDDVFGIYRRLSFGRGSDFEIDQDRAWDSMLSETESVWPEDYDWTGDEMPVFTQELKYTNDDRGRFNTITNELTAVGVLFPCSGGKVQVVQRDQPSSGIRGALEFAEIIGNLFVRVHNPVTVADLEYMAENDWDYIADGVFRSGKLRKR